MVSFSQNLSQRNLLLLHANALSAIEVILFGRVTDARLGRFPIEVTLFGMVTDVRPVSVKAKSPIEVTLFGMVTDLILMA